MRKPLVYPEIFPAGLHLFCEGKRKVTINEVKRNPINRIPFVLQSERDKLYIEISCTWKSLQCTYF